MTDPDPLGPEPTEVFEQVLDRAMALEQVAEPLDRCTAAIGREELRDAALRARHTIAAFADAEYRAYLGLLTSASGRTGARQAGACRAAASRGADGQSAISKLLRRASAAAGLALLLAGHMVRSLDGRPYVGDALLTAGLLIGAMAVGAAVGDLIWLVMEARNRSAATDDDASESPDAGVAKARAAWETALLERGMVPFLLGRLEEARTGEREDRAAR